MASGLVWLSVVAVVVVAVWGALFLVTLLVVWRVRRTMPPSGNFIEIAGHTIHYTDEGRGPTLLLIHGLGGQIGNFAYLVDRLKAKYRVVALDRPGNGYSTKPASASSGIASQAQIIAQFIEKLDLDRPLVVGHSLGGAVALALVVNHAELVSGAALLAPLSQQVAGPPDAFKAMAIRSSWRRRLMAWTVAVPGSILNGARIGNMIFAPEAIPADFVSRTRGLLSLRPAAFYGASSDLVAAPDDLPDLVTQYGSITLPIGILFGAGDRILDALVHGKHLAATIPGAIFEMVEGAGHMIPVTLPKQASDFIKRISDMALSANRLREIQSHVV
ncbi:alpha/beta fold hydrolase [Oleomonas cavernae]|uniref:Alpha/beta fold hydrolase n=1 Tax=Oleomonas cavernae TaxID=2320859 RepID=A0A418WH04_9PROT|nr:alpha/beta fold hydrolase [Oleomonas cavernae]RJF89317.1 alpha/beta fold hydrolase [Oleomonas cavernae]